MLAAPLPPFLLLESCASALSRSFVLRRTAYKYTTRKITYVDELDALAAGEAQARAQVGDHLQLDFWLAVVAIQLARARHRLQQLGENQAILEVALEVANVSLRGAQVSPQCVVHPVGERRLLQPFPTVVHRSRHGCRAALA